MNHWTRVNLALALLLALLIVLYLRPAMQPSAGDTLATLAPDTITAVRVERGRRLMLSLQRSGDSWQITHPKAGPASQRRVAQLLAIAQAPVAFRYPDDGGLARFGLDNPRAVQLNACAWHSATATRRRPDAT